MSPEPGTPAPRAAGRKAARTRRRLLETARVVFSRASVDQVKVHDIADLAGVAVGTIYAHFDGKVGLALACEGAVLDLLIRDLDVIKAEPSPIKRVLAAGDAYLQHVVRHPVGVRMASARAAYPGDELGNQAAGSADLDRRMRSVLMGVAADLKAAMDCGEIRRVPIDEAMIFIWGAWNGVAFMVARGDQLRVPPGTAARALALGQELLLAGASPEQGAA